MKSIGCFLLIVLLITACIGNSAEKEKEHSLYATFSSSLPLSYLITGNAMSGLTHTWNNMLQNSARSRGQDSVLQFVESDSSKANKQNEIATFGDLEIFIISSQKSLANLSKVYPLSSYSIIDSLQKFDFKNNVALVASHIPDYQNNLIYYDDMKIHSRNNATIYCELSSNAIENSMNTYAAGKWENTIFAVTKNDAKTLIVEYRGQKKQFIIN